MQIKVIQSDITKLGKDIDAIVNATNESLLAKYKNILIYK